MRLAGKAMWDKPRGKNLLDRGSPCYDVYECKGKGYMAVGTLEPHFFGNLLKGLDLDRSFARKQHDRSTWPAMRDAIRSRFLQKTRREWEGIFDGQDACCTPILSQSELEETRYDQRAAVGLSETPALPIDQVQAWKGSALVPGTRREKMPQSWLLGNAIGISQNKEVP
jgi:alpha-methylacyl-CoA racemase